MPVSTCQRSTSSFWFTLVPLPILSRIRARIVWLLRTTMPLWRMCSLCLQRFLICTLPLRSRNSLHQTQQLIGKWALCSSSLTLWKERKHSLTGHKFKPLIQLLQMERQARPNLWLFDRRILLRRASIQQPKVKIPASRVLMSNLLLRWIQMGLQQLTISTQDMILVLTVVAREWTIISGQRIVPLNQVHKWLLKGSWWTMGLQPRQTSSQKECPFHLQVSSSNLKEGSQTIIVTFLSHLCSDHQRLDRYKRLVTAFWSLRMYRELLLQTVSKADMQVNWQLSSVHLQSTRRQGKLVRIVRSITTISTRLRIQEVNLRAANSHIMQEAVAMETNTKAIWAGMPTMPLVKVHRLWSCARISLPLFSRMPAQVTTTITILMAHRRSQQFCNSRSSWLV